MHELVIGEGAVDMTVGFIDVPQPIRDSNIVESKNEVMMRCILNLITLVRDRIAFAITV